MLEIVIQFNVVNYVLCPVNTIIIIPLPN